MLNLLVKLTQLKFDACDSTVRHQYPHPVEGYANDYFAEYMLPEGAHNREQDWTVLFLNRQKPRVDEV